MKDKIAEEVKESIRKLDAWVEKNGWAGYDPYDIKRHPWLLKLGSWNRALWLVRGGGYC